MKLNCILVMSLALIVTACPFRHPNGDATSYSVEVTGLLSVEPKGDSLNDFDAAAGTAFVNFGNVGPVVWLNGELRAVPQTFDFGLLHGINNRGAVVGTELFTAPGTFFHFVSFVDAVAPMPQTNVSGQLYSVNEFNEYVGTADGLAALGLVNGGEPTLFDGEDGDTAAAYDINDWGDFVGSTFNTTAGVQLAVKWLRGERMLLDSLGGPFSEAYAINNHGTVVGVSTFAPATKTTEPHKAVCWPDTNVVELPGLGGDESTAWDINDEGEAVGFALDQSGNSRAVLWSAPDQSGDIGVTDLNDLVDLGDLAPGSLILREAVDINEAGTILCRADQIDGAMTETVYVLLRR